MNVTTTQGSNANGTTTVTAKGLNRQRTIKSDPALSTEVNHAAAVGTLLAAVATDREKAMLLHPSGGQRVSRDVVSDGGGKYLWTIKF